MTPEEFFPWLVRQDVKHELVNGTPILFTGICRQHANVQMRMQIIFDKALNGAHWQVLTSQIAIVIPNGNVRYPDLSVDAGTGSEDDMWATDPVLIVLVFSELTGYFDLARKVRDYREVQSLKYIVVIFSKEPIAEFYCRGENGNWSSEILEGPNANIELPILNLIFLLSNFYPQTKSNSESVEAEPDFAQTLESTFFRLKELDIAAKNKDTPAILAGVAEIDWTMVYEELEPVVYGTYKRAVYHHARRAIRNLLRPYMLYHHIVSLRTIQDMIEWHLTESPSLYETAEELVKKAWTYEIQKAGFLKKQIREISPILTLADLCRAIDEKIAAGHALERVPGPYQSAERVPYP